MKKILTTERLVLRETSMEDFDGLYAILSDPVAMKHYPKPYTREMVERWISWCMESYQQNGFGLWAVCLKDTMEYIGDCGLSLQNIDGKMLPEIGYHISRAHQHKGYATEAARAVKDYIFTTLGYDEIYTYMKYTNVNSYSAAIKNDMSLHHEYADPKNEISRAFYITRKTWEAYKRANEDMLLRKAMPKDIQAWMEYTKESEEHKAMVLKAMDSGFVNVAILDGSIIGALVYSRDGIQYMKVSSDAAKRNLLLVAQADIGDTCGRN